MKARGTVTCRSGPRHSHGSTSWRPGAAPVWETATPAHCPPGDPLPESKCNLGGQVRELELIGFNFTALDCILLHYTEHHCTALQITALYCTILYLYYTVLVLHFTCTTLYLYYTTWTFIFMHIYLFYKYGYGEERGLHHHAQEAPHFEQAQRHWSTRSRRQQGSRRHTQD